MNLNGGMMILIGYFIGYMFGQMAIRDELKKQGIVFKSSKPSLITRVMDIFSSKPNNTQNINQKTPPATPPTSQGMSQSQPPMPPHPESKNNINNYKN